MATATTIDPAKIEELATLQFSVEEIAVIADVSPEDIEGDPQAARAFLRGRLLAQAEVRTAVLAAAKQGSTPAQKQFQEYAAASAIHYDREE